MRLPPGLCHGPRCMGGLQCPHTPSLKRLGHTTRLTTLLKNRSRATASLSSYLKSSEIALMSALFCFRMNNAFAKRVIFYVTNIKIEGGRSISR